MAPISTDPRPSSDEQDDNQISLAPQIGCKGPTRKRRRTKEDGPTVSTEPKRCIFDKLPFELLAEIFILTNSPKDVLAVTRCSKFFCATLLGPSSPFIWRAVRKAYPLPVPDPMSTFTEASYAAFLFDGGTCEVCKKTTEVMYVSFGIRLRLCRDHRCTVKYIESGDLQKAERSLVHDAKIHQCLPYLESERCFEYNRIVYRESLYRANDWLRELHDCAASPEDYLTRNKEKIGYFDAYMKFCKSLHEWKEARQKLYRSNEAANETFAKGLAEKYGWDYWDMMKTAAYGALHLHKNRRIENVTQDDYDLLASEVDKALAKLKETRTRRIHEAAYRENRQGVAQHYQRLRSRQPPTILPSLPVFRRLPIVMMLQGSSPATTEHPTNVSSTLLKESWVVQRLDLELKQWREKARKDLGAVLGYPDWNTASKTTLHPVDRIMARFLCKVCSKVALRYRDDNCLDFAGACAHVCHGTKKNKEDEVWKAERFIKDDKAIAVLSKLLAFCKADESFAEATATVSALGTTILCTSCESGLLLNYKSIVGHAHRHENMEIKLLPRAEAVTYLIQHPLIPSLVRSLTGLERRVTALREKVNYGCRHCFNMQRKLRDKNVSGDDDQQFFKAVVAEDQGTKRRFRGAKAEKQFSFNSLWSHLKSKHGVDGPRDEDVFVYDPFPDFKDLSLKYH